MFLSVNNLCCVTNDNQNDREIFYHIDDNSVQHGGFYVRGAPETVFTKGDLEEGVVSYRHTDMDRWENTDIVRFNIRTDFNTYITQDNTIFIDLPQADRIPAVNSGLRVTEGQVACLNLTALDARNVRYQSWQEARGTRPELLDMDIQFVLSQLPVRGMLYVQGRPLTSLPNHFTHSDLASGTVCYHHDNTETTIDSFRFRLSVVGPEFKRDYSNLATLNIDIIPVNDIRPILETVDPRVTLVRDSHTHLHEKTSGSQMRTPAPRGAYIPGIIA